MNVFPRPQALGVSANEASLSDSDRAVLEEARDIINRAEQIQADAKKEGYQQGMTEARKEALTMLVNVVKGNIESISELEQSVVDVCLDAYRSFFGLLGHERMLAGLVHKAISQLPAQQSILVRTSPDQLEDVQRRLDEMTLPTTSAVSIVPDQAVEDGQCVVQTDTSTTNLNIEVQVDILFELLKKHFK